MTSLDTATMDLPQIRSVLRNIIGPQTIIIGHAYVFRGNLAICLDILAKG